MLTWSPATGRMYAYRQAHGVGRTFGATEGDVKRARVWVACRAASHRELHIWVSTVLGKRRRVDGRQACQVAVQIRFKCGRQQRGVFHSHWLRARRWAGEQRVWLDGHGIGTRRVGGAVKSTGDSGFQVGCCSNRWHSNQVWAAAREGAVGGAQVHAVVDIEGIGELVCFQEDVFQAIDLWVCTCSVPILELARQQKGQGGPGGTGNSCCVWRL